MSHVTKVAITGGIGAGKSSMCQILIQQGFPVISADQQAQKALIKNSPIYSDILKLFPNNLILDPKQIAEKIFSQPLLKKSFENIVHPYIFQCIKEEEKKIIQQGDRVIFYEIPLLFETDMFYYFNYIILITCPKELKIERVKKRMNIPEEQIFKRMFTQAQHDESKVHFVVENSKSLKDLEKSTKDILHKLQLKKGSHCSL